jgi:hypothetical protein
MRTHGGLTLERWHTVVARATRSLHVLKYAQSLIAVSLRPQASSPEVVDGLPVRRPQRASRRGAVGGAPGGASQKPRPPKLERQVRGRLG